MPCSAPRSSRMDRWYRPPTRRSTSAFASTQPPTPVHQLSRSAGSVQAAKTSAGDARRTLISWTRFSSEGPMGLVAPLAHADGDHGHALGARNRTACRPGIEAEKRAGAHGDRLALDLIDARAFDDHVDLFLARVDLVVLVAAHVWAELEPVDPEGLYAELPPHEANGAPRPLAVHLLDVHHAVAHPAPLFACEMTVT